LNHGSSTVQTKRAADYVTSSSSHATSGDRRLDLRLPASVVVEDEAKVLSLGDIFFRRTVYLEVSSPVPDSWGEDQDVALAGVHNQTESVKETTRQPDQDL
jgi:hypothetical protein